MTLTRINNQALTNVTSAGLPSGTVIGHAKSYYDTKVTWTSLGWNDTASISYTPKSANSTLIIKSQFHYSGKGAFRCLVDGTALVTPVQNFALYNNDAQTNAFNSSHRGVFNVQYYYDNTSTTAKAIKMQLTSYAAAGASNLGVNEVFENLDFSFIEVTEIAG